MDKIYEDFTANVLPKISEGLTMTKDYFFDLFGRYVHYFTVVDSIALFISIAFLFLIIFLWTKFFLYAKKEEEFDDGFFIPFTFAILIISIINIIITFDIAKNLIKDIYIPEVRVYEELKNFNK